VLGEGNEVRDVAEQERTEPREEERIEFRPRGGGVVAEQQCDVAHQAEHQRSHDPRLRVPEVGRRGRDDEQDERERLQRDLEAMLPARDRHPVSDRRHCGQDQEGDGHPLEYAGARVATYSLSGRL
jgi:hypothetical protein